MTTASFDQLDGVIWMNGEMVKWPDARLHVLTHGLHYGSSVFEGERMYGGEIFKLTEHTERLFASAEILGFEILYTIEEIDKACRDACAQSGLTEAYIRPVAWRGSEQMGVSAQNNRINVAIGAWDWGSYFDPLALPGAYFIRFHGGSLPVEISPSYLFFSTGDSPALNLPHCAPRKKRGGDTYEQFGGWTAFP